MKQQFMKMHGAGNDYLFIDALTSPPPPHPSRLAKTLSDRHFGVGGDGLVLILPSAVSDAKMQMFNCDGSEGRMCGNAIRCMGQYLFSRQGERERLEIETRSGIKTLYWDKRTKSVWVNMGKVTPMTSPKRGVPFGVKQRELTAYPVSVGNPHLVCFCPPSVSFSQKEWDAITSRMPCFYGGVNVEMAWVIDRQNAEVRVFERGSGETLSCGTGATAVAAVGMALGTFEKTRPVYLRFKGGTLIVTKDDAHRFWLGGDTKFVCSGEIEIEDFM